MKRAVERVSEQAAIGKEFEDRAARGRAPDFTAGDALIQPSLNRISLDGRVSQVEPKVMQVLTLMAMRPGAVISRETFLDTVWAGTIGDDYLLNRAVSELRKIFDDDAQAPRYIETIRKGGYRLIAPIAPAKVAAAVAQPRPDEPVSGSADPGAQSTGRTPAFRIFPVFGRAPALYGLAVACVVVAAAIFVLWPSENGAGGAASYDIRPLTSFVGREYDPALSPDGSRVAFVWDGGDGETFDVYAKTIGSEGVLNLTNSEMDERHPVWSADGRSVMFARSDASGSSIMRVSALGGGVTRILRDDTAADINSLSVSPDGAWIAYARRPNAASPYRIVLASLSSAETRIVTQPEPGSLGDIDPLFAHDGQSIFFVRAVNGVTKDLYRASPGGGEPTRLTFDNRKINGLTWSPDGDRLLFTSTRSGMYRVWSADPGGGDLKLVPFGNEDVQQPSTAAGFDAVAFEQWMHRAQLRRIDLVRRMETDAVVYMRSTRWDSNPAYSPDSERIAFSSNRGGPYSIWISDRDGRNAVQLADFNGAFVDNPAWSPDGALIAFDASPDGETAIFTVPPEGGAPRRITNGPGDSRNPVWSRDGAWIYFESNRDGAWRIYAQPADGGTPVRITDGPGVNPRESVDGAWLLYTKPDTPGLWRRPTDDRREEAATGSEELLIGELAFQDGANWAPASNGVYFVRRPSAGAPVLSFFDYATRSAADIVTLSASFEGWGFDISPDETTLLYSELLMQESDLRLAVPRQAPPRTYGSGQR